MSKPSAADLRRLSTLSQLTLCNPFTPERIQLEQTLLGKAFVADDGIAWSRNIESEQIDHPVDRANVVLLTQLATELTDRARQHAQTGTALASEHLEHYWNTATYLLLYRHITPKTPTELLKPAGTAKAWRDFLADYRTFVAMPGIEQINIHSAGHLFACLHQVHRAFLNIYDYILGDSLPTVQLRAAVWQSIFTHDLNRYRNTLYRRMGELPSLITGPSGTGKELVARAIGLSQYIPFNEKAVRFAATDQDSFYPLNLSAFSANLIESELFGHRKGSFTGAIADRKGWLEMCLPHGAIFLDEIGELEPALQVKLLRVVQQRTFSRLGETEERTFCGKIIVATNRDLGVEMAEGRFREDLYYRLCADRIQTPNLREQLDDRPDDLHALTRYIVRKIAGDDAQSLCEQVVEWILKNLGKDYPWRGNIRELEQCIGSIMIRGEYHPATGAGTPVTRQPAWINDILASQLTADQLLQKYCTWIYHHTNSYEAAARQLGIDRRTVKAKIDRKMLERLSEAPPAGTTATPCET